MIPGSGRSAGEGDGNPLQYYCLENPTDRGAWQSNISAFEYARLVITFLPRNKHLLISWLQSPSAVIVEPKKIKSDTFHFHALEKEMANPLQCSCLENPRDGGAWWSSIYGVTQSRTQLMRLSSTVLLFKVLNLE